MRLLTSKACRDQNWRHQILRWQNWHHPHPMHILVAEQRCIWVYTTLLHPSCQNDQRFPTHSTGSLRSLRSLHPQKSPNSDEAVMKPMSYMTPAPPVAKLDPAHTPETIGSKYASEKNVQPWHPWNQGQHRNHSVKWHLDKGLSEHSLSYDMNRHAETGFRTMSGVQLSAAIASSNPADLCQRRQAPHAQSLQALVGQVGQATSPLPAGIPHAEL